jgi:hypothetical protein
MGERDLGALRARALRALGEVAQAAAGALDAEGALRHFTAATAALLGDEEAPLRPGGLKPGERQYTVSAIFLITGDRRHNLLFAEHGFPPEQHRLRVPIGLGHPGWVAAHQRALIIPNTDDNADFRQILKTSRMGSALYGPMIWRGQMLGQLMTAAQARNTYGPADLEILVAFAHVAAAVYVAHGGPDLLRSLG